MADIMCRRSASYSHDADRDGLCRWCRQRVSAPGRAPERFPLTDLTEAYGYFYDPDWGVE